MTEAPAVWRRSTRPPFSFSRGWWLRPAARKGRILTLPEPIRLNYSGASQVRQFGAANQRPSSLSDLRYVPQISSTGSSRCPPAQAMRKESAPGLLSGLGQSRQFGTAKQPRRQTTKQHLYLVLDDHVDGFNIHKLDIDNDLNIACGSASAENPLRFSKSPVLHIGPPTIGKRAQFAALGNHIIATCPSAPEIPTVQKAHDSVTLIFDTKTDMVTTSTILPSGIIDCYDAAIAVRNRLYVFESFTKINDGDDSLYFCGGFHCLSADPNDDDRDWSWRPLFNSSQFSWSWYKSPPNFPFDPKFITSLAVHPRTGTIFVSACWQDVWGTFSYGTRGGGQWKRRGDWVLPFKGPAHYDDVLGAWVGLHIHSVETGDADGYLCACHIISVRQPPKWKVGSEKLFLKHPHWRHVDAKLVHMGGPSKYCLVERLVPEGGGKMNYVLRVTTFIVKYSEDGELITTVHRPACFYQAPSYRCCFDVQAFWM